MCDGGVNLRVGVRVRPLSSSEQKKRMAKVVSTPGGCRVAVNHGCGGRVAVERGYSFDHVWGPYATQRDVFEAAVRPVCEEVLTGFNCTIFAYGQTGTGKTYTIEGAFDREDDAGVVPRAARNLYDNLRDKDFNVRVSCLEVYNEELADLLDDDRKNKKNVLRLQEGSDGQIQCANLEEVSCDTVEECLGVLRRGSKARKVAATLCNDKSSRSHVVFALKVCTRSIADDGRELVVNGQLNVVDLAGSECAGRSGASAGRGAREAGAINQSLLTLGRVITTLTSPKSDSAYVPYRDSKLTRILQDSLGGKAKTTLIATVSPCKDAVEESLSTLAYAQRARNIKNTPEQRARYHGKAVLKHISAEMDELHKLLRIQREKNGGVLVPGEQWDDLQEQLASCRQDADELRAALSTSRGELDRVNAEKRDLSARVESLQAEIVEVESRLEKATAELAEERSAHAATRSVEAALRANEKRLLSDGEALALVFSDCRARLVRAFDEIHQRIADLREDAGSAAEIGVSATETKGAVVERLAKSLRERSEAVDGAAAALQSVVATVHDKCADAIGRIFDDVGALVADVSEAADRDELDAARHGSLVATELVRKGGAFRESARSAASVADSIKASIGALSSTAEEARKAVEDERGRAIPERTREATKVVEESWSSLRTDLLDPAVALSKKSAEERETLTRREVEKRSEQHALDRSLIEEARTRLRETFTSLIDTELSKLLESREASRAEEVARAADTESLISKTEADRIDLLSRAVGKTANFAETASKSLEKISKETSQSLFLVEVPESEAFEGVRNAVAEAAKNQSQHADSSATELEKYGEDFQAKLKQEAGEKCKKRKADAARRLDKVQRKQAEIVEETKARLDEHLSLTDQYRKEQKVEAEGVSADVNAAVAKLEARSSDHAQTMANRPSEATQVTAVDNFHSVTYSFKPTEPRDVLVTRFFSETEGNCAKNAVAHDQRNPTTPLRDSSNEF